VRVRFSPSVLKSLVVSVGRFLFLDSFLQLLHFHNLSESINIYRKIGLYWEHIIGNGQRGRSGLAKNCTVYPPITFFTELIDMKELFEEASH